MVAPAQARPPFHEPSALSEHGTALSKLTPTTLPRRAVRAPSLQESRGLLCAEPMPQVPQQQN